METVLGSLITLKENKTGQKQPLLDLTKYLEADKFFEANKKYMRKFEKVFEELDSLRRDLTEIQMLNEVFK